MSKTIKEILDAIRPDPREGEAREAAHRQWASIAKPLDSLGLLETAVEDMAALTLNHKIDISHRALLLLCADNGVVDQGVTQTDYTVTAAVARNAGANRSSVCKMAQVANCKVVPVDMGMRDPGTIPGVMDRRVGNGTHDITEGPAMSRDQAEQAVLTGVELVEELKGRGAGLIATGEMGIGNTTTSSAVACALLNRPVAEMTGRGRGCQTRGWSASSGPLKRRWSATGPTPWTPWTY